MNESDRVTTPSGIEIPNVATAADHEPTSSQPGEYPFTRGIFPDGYRGKLWTIRQYSGFGSAEESNRRYRFLLDQGQTGLSVALDLPTQCGFDPVDSMARAEIGKVGVSLSTLDEMAILFDGIDLAKISTSFTINGTAAILFAMYLALADRKGIPRSALTGTIQNDILKEFVARGTWIFPVKPSVRLVADSVLYANQEAPRFNPISIAGAHVRDAGSTAIEEMGFTLANGLAYVDELVRRGGDIERFTKRLSFFFYVHMDLFEEVAKFRAARRLWAKLMKKRGVKHPKGQQFRFGVVCGGASLTAEQPVNNIVRVGIETLAAVFGGAQSVFTCAYDEAFQIPTEESAEIALRTQQIVAHESGVSKTVDPLGGSHYVEYLTDQSEKEISRVIQEIEDYGGVVKAVEDGYLQSRIAHRAKQRKDQTDSGERVVVGVNRYRRPEPESPIGETFRLDPGAASAVVDRYKRTLDSRDNAKVESSLARLAEAARDDGSNVMPFIVDCCHALATVGEVSKCLKQEWGAFQEPIRF